MRKSASEVKVLLEVVQDVKLQRELKKLANRSWELDRKAGRISAQAQQAQNAAAAAGTVPPGSPRTARRPRRARVRLGERNPGRGQRASRAGSGRDSDGGGVARGQRQIRGGPEGAWNAPVRTTLGQGEEGPDGQPLLRGQAPSAANSFKDFKKAAADSVKRIHLNARPRTWTAACSTSPICP